jgi:hypothetical protein
MSQSTDRPDLLPLVFAAVDHAIDSLADAGGPLTPFVLVAEGDSVTLHRFVAETLEGGRDRALAFMAQANGATTMVAMAYDGYLTCDGERADAVFDAVQRTGTTTSDLSAQRYAEHDRTIDEIGNVKHVSIDEPPLLPAGVAPAPPAAPAASEKRGVLGRLRGRR